MQRFAFRNAMRKHCRVNSARSPRNNLGVTHARPHLVRAGATFPPVAPYRLAFLAMW